MRKEIPAQVVYYCDLCKEEMELIKGYGSNNKHFCFLCVYKIIAKVELSIRPIKDCTICKGTKIDQHEYFYEGVKEPCQCQRKLKEIFI